MERLKLNDQAKEKFVMTDPDFCRHMDQIETELSKNEISVFFAFCVARMIQKTS
jgi:hypothetical protein